MEAKLHNRFSHSHYNNHGTKVYDNNVSFEFESQDSIANCIVGDECTEACNGDFSSHEGGGYICPYEHPRKCQSSSDRSPNLNFGLVYPIFRILLSLSSFASCLLLYSLLEL